MYALPMSKHEYKDYLSKEDINLLPPMDWDGEIIEIVTPEGAQKALKLIAEEKVVGFDTETKPSFVKNQIFTPALLQVATHTRAYIFRLKFFEPPQEIADFLSNPNILKVGVGIHDDLLGLKRIIKFTPGGFVDIAVEARKRGFKNEGLRGLTGIFLEKRLSKGAKLMNWENEVLPEKMMRYAALDAVLGIMIYDKLMELP